MAHIAREIRDALAAWLANKGWRRTSSTRQELTLRREPHDDILYELRFWALLGSADLGGDRKLSVKCLASVAFHPLEDMLREAKAEPAGIRQAYSVRADIGLMTMPRGSLDLGYVFDLAESVGPQVASYAELVLEVTAAFFDRLSSLAVFEESSYQPIGVGWVPWETRRALYFWIKGEKQKARAVAALVERQGPDELLGIARRTHDELVSRGFQSTVGTATERLDENPLWQEFQRVDGHIKRSA